MPVNECKYAVACAWHLVMFGLLFVVVGFVFVFLGNLMLGLLVLFCSLILFVLAAATYHVFEGWGYPSPEKECPVCRVLYGEGENEDR